MSVDVWKCTLFSRWSFILMLQFSPLWKGSPFSIGFWIFYIDPITSFSALLKNTVLLSGGNFQKSICPLFFTAWDQPFLHWALILYHWIESYLEFLIWGPMILTQLKSVGCAPMVSLTTLDSTFSPLPLPQDSLSSKGKYPIGIFNLGSLSA